MIHSDQLSRVLRFLVAGGSATAVNLGTLYCLTEFFHMWYLASSIVAMVVGVVVSFTLQKFWTFRNSQMNTVHVQFLQYALLALINLGLNTLSLYILVEHVHLWYMLAQVITSAVLAVMNFFIYRGYIFAQKVPEAHEV